MASITTTLGLAPGDATPHIRTHIWTNADSTTHAALYFRIGHSEFGFNASAEQVDQILRDGLNALGEALDAHEAATVVVAP